MDKNSMDLDINNNNKQPLTQRVLTVPSEPFFVGWFGLPKYGSIVISDVIKEGRYYNTYLVRGIGKRAIKVIVIDTNEKTYRTKINLDKLAALAAVRANKKGWKVIIVQPDYIKGVACAAILNKTQVIDKYDKYVPIEHLVQPERIDFCWS